MPEEDLIEKIIGRFGRYQAWISTLITIAHLPSDFQMNNVLFVLPDVSYVCMDENAFNITNHCPCKTPVYDTSTIVESATTEWNLICDRKSFASLAQSMMQLGMLIGSLVFSYISDRYGRKNAVLLSLFLQPLFQTMALLVPEYWMFAACRLLIGTATGGTYLCCYVMLIEFGGKSCRSYLVGINEFPYVLGYILLAIIAYYVRTWRRLLLVTATPWLLVIVYYWLLPESPRWLITVGKKEEAIQLLTHIARKNKRPTQNIKGLVEEIEKQSKCENKEQYGSYFDLFRTREIRVYTIINALMWLCCALTYFGIGQYMGRLEGNFYQNILISALCHIPGLAFVIVSTMFIRRQLNVIITFSVAALSLLTFIFIPNDVQTALLTFAIIGQLAIYSSFCLIYLYTTEVFPTVVRNSAMGLASVFARFGGFMAPFIVNIGIEWISIVIFSISAFFAAFLTYLLPETKDIVLLNSIQQMEEVKKVKKTENGLR